MGSTLLLLLLAASITLIGFVVTVAWRPFSQYSLLQNGATLVLLAAGCVSIVTAACHVKRACEWTIFAVCAVLLGFLVRSLPALTLVFPPGHDGYYYFASLLNIVDGKSLDPVYGDWYGGIGPLLNWPLMQLLTAEVSAWTSSSLRDLWTFLPAALGSLTFLAISLITRIVASDWRVAAIAGLLGSFADIVLFYQSEFHPQGLAIMLFPVVIYLALQSGGRHHTGLRLLAVIAGAAFLFTHHASSLLLPILLVPVLAVPYLPGRWMRRRVDSPQEQGTQNESLSIRRGAPFGGLRPLIVLLIVSGISMQLYLADDVLRLLLVSLDRTASTVTPAAPSEWWISALRLGKYVVLLLCAVGILIELRRAQLGGIVLVAITGALAVAAIGSFALGGPGSDRVIGLWAIFASVFAAVALVRVLEWRRLGRLYGPAIAVSIAATYIAVSILNSQPPAFVLQGTPRSAGVFYGNALPRLDRIALAGSWLADRTPTDATYAVDFATIPAPFFFARRSLTSLIYDPVSGHAYCDADYFVRDYQLSDEEFLSGTIPLERTSHSRVYDNGSVAIGERQTNGLCGGRTAPRFAPRQTAGPSVTPLDGDLRHELNPIALAATVFGLMSAVVLVWAVGYLVILLFAARMLRPRQIEAAAALLLGIGLSGLLLIGPTRFLTNPFWFEWALTWTTPLALAVGIVALVALSIRRHVVLLRRMPAIPFGRMALASWRSWSLALCLTAITGVVIAARPDIGATIELYGARADGQLSIDVASSASPTSQCTLRVTDDQDAIETPRFNLTTDERIAMSFTISGMALVDLTCFPDGESESPSTRSLVFQAERGR